MRERVGKRGRGQRTEKGGRGGKVGEIGEGENIAEGEKRRERGPLPCHTLLGHKVVTCRVMFTLSLHIMYLVYICVIIIN